ncbi:MAG: hypothetical protein GY898_13630 [Proteobacteria bacterium]|nr:hypothetical protein [Pseudomonadota bacterium]
MSARALQRVAIRMHHDPYLVAAVYDDPDAALADEELTADERAMLIAPDQRAWGTDPARVDRVLEALRRELPVSCAIVELASGSRRALLRFFSDEAFHDCVSNRGVLVFAFADWLQDQGREGRWGRIRLTAVATLEGACARVRRGLPGDGLTVELPDGTIELFAALSAALPTGRVPGLNRLPRLRSEPSEYLRVERKEGPGAELSVYAVEP